MATISIDLQPVTDSIQASDTPIIYRFSSTKYLEQNFSFIVETFINGVSVSVDMVFPERGNRAHFDAMQITLPNIRALARSTTAHSLQNFSTLQVKVAERYGAVPVTYTFQASNTCKVMKARCEDEDFVSEWVPTNYVPDVNWLTDVPDNTFKLSRENAAWFSILTIIGSVTTNFRFYDADGVLLHTNTEITGAADKVNVKISPAIIDAMLSATAYVYTDIFSMEIDCNGSDILYIQFTDEDCELKQQVSWMNKLGVFDQHLFTHNREIAFNTDTKEFKKQFGNWNSAGTDFVHDATDSGDTAYIKETTPTGTLHTGWISEAYQNWLIELLQGLDVQLQTSSVIEAITITDSKGQQAQTKYEEVFNFSVNYKKTNFKSVTQ